MPVRAAGTQRRPGRPARSISVAGGRFARAPAEADRTRTRQTDGTAACPLRPGTMNLPLHMARRPIPSLRRPFFPPPRGPWRIPVWPRPRSKAYCFRLMMYRGTSDGRGDIPAHRTAVSNHGKTALRPEGGAVARHQECRNLERLRLRDHRIGACNLPGSPRSIAITAAPCRFRWTTIVRVLPRNRWAG